MRASTAVAIALVVLAMMQSRTVMADGSSSSSVPDDEDPKDSNIAAAVGACVGVVFLVALNRYLEWKYPNAAVGFQ